MFDNGVNSFTHADRWPGSTSENNYRISIQNKAWAVNVDLGKSAYINVFNVRAKQHPIDLSHRYDFISSLSFLNSIYLSWETLTPTTGSAEMIWGYDSLENSIFKLFFKVETSVVADFQTGLQENEGIGSNFAA